MRLVPDDTPIRGRVYDLQGKPVVGASVRLIRLRLPNKADLPAFIEALKASKDGYPLENSFLTALEISPLAQLFAPASTRTDGRFQFRSIGRVRIAMVEISGPTIETRHVRVITRPGEQIDRLEWNDGLSTGKLTYYGAALSSSGKQFPLLVTCGH